MTIIGPQEVKGINEAVAKIREPVSFENRTVVIGTFVTPRIMFNADMGQIVECVLAVDIAKTTPDTSSP